MEAVVIIVYFCNNLQGVCRIRETREKSGNLDFLKNVREKSGKLLKFLDNQGEIREKDLICC